MRRSFPIALTCCVLLLSVLLFSHSSSVAAPDGDCDCEAPDHSCSLSLSCAGGCTRFCGNLGNCFGECSGGYGYLATETTLEMQNATYPQLVTALAHQSGKQVVFVPMRPDLVFNAGFKRSPFWNALELLSEQGTIQIGGQDFERLKKLRSILLAGEKITLCVKNTPVSTFVSDMVGLTGLNLRVTGGSPMALVNVRVPDATFDDMLKEVGQRTGTKIEVAQPPGQQGQ